MNQQQKDEQAQDAAATPPVVRLAAAEVDVVAAKDRLNDTVARLQSKLDPKLLAKEATDEVKRVGSQGLGVARDNQSILGGLAGGVLIYLIGRPLLRAIFSRRKYPKPQKAAKPMTATAANDRLARSPHPTAPATPKTPLAAAPHPSQATGGGSVLSTPAPSQTAAMLGATGHPTANPAPSTATTQSGEGAPIQGSIA